MWTQILFAKQYKKRFSNAPVENWFGQNKKTVLEGQRNLRPNRFVLKVRNSVEGLVKEVLLNIPKEGCARGKRKPKNKLSLSLKKRNFEVNSSIPAKTTSMSSAEEPTSDLNLVPEDVASGPIGGLHPEPFSASVMNAKTTDSISVVDVMKTKSPSAEVESSKATKANPVVKKTGKPRLNGPNNKKIQVTKTVRPVTAVTNSEVVDLITVPDGPDVVEEILRKPSKLPANFLNNRVKRFLKGQDGIDRKRLDHLKTLILPNCLINDKLLCQSSMASLRYC